MTNKRQKSKKKWKKLKKGVDKGKSIWYITSALWKRKPKTKGRSNVNDLWKLSKKSKIWVARLN